MQSGQCSALAQRDRPSEHGGQNERARSTRGARGAQLCLAFRLQDARELQR